MARQFVVRPLAPAVRESAEGVMGEGFSGRQIVIYADSQGQALAMGEQRLGISADKLEAIPIDYSL